jgi:hypothetical protein
MALKSPEIRAKKDKCTLVASVDHGRLRILGVSNEPLIILEGQVCELKASGGRCTSSRGMQSRLPRSAEPP